MLMHKWFVMIMVLIMWSCTSDKTPESASTPLPIIEGFSVEFVNIDFAAAQLHAKEVQKGLLLDFYADW
jgi:hypothetical protein